MRTYLILATLAFAVPAAAVVGGGDITFAVKKGGKAVAGPATFSHALHVKAKLGCKECHPKLFLDTARSKRFTMAQMKKGQSCGACHDGNRAHGLDACNTCHR